MTTSNFSKIGTLQSATAELFAEVTKAGFLTSTDRYQLKTALLENSLTEDEQRSINRLLYAIRRGRLALGD